MERNNNFRTKAVVTITTLFFTFTVGLPTDTHSQDVVIRTLKVMNNGGTGVRSEIFLLPPLVLEKGSGLFTDEEGVLRSVITCSSPFNKIVAVARSGYFYRSRNVKCSENMVIKLSSFKVVNNMFASAVEAANSNHHALSANLFNEVYAQTAHVDPHFANIARMDAIEQTGQALGVAAPLFFDPMQDMDVASGELVAKVMEYQKKSGLKANGKINPPTLRELSGHNVGNLIARALRNN